MKKTLLVIALCFSPALILAAQTPVTTIDKFNSATTKINDMREATNLRLGVIELDRQDHETRVAAMETGKAAVSCFADSAAFNACFALDWPTGFDTAGDYIVTGEWDFTGATVTGISSGGITHATSDGAYYASKDGAWANIAGVFLTPTGSAASLTSFPSSLATDTEVTSAINALPSLAFGTGLTTSTDSPSAGTDTISVTANTYQAYDADLTTWAGVTPGAGVATALAVNADTVGGLPTIIAKGAYTVDTASIAANTCASAVAVTATGVATTDVVIAASDSILSTVAGFGVTTAGAVRVDVYPTSGNVNFQFCNPTGAAIDPGSVTFNWKVLR